MTATTLSTPHRRCERCDFRHDSSAPCVEADTTDLDYRLDELIAAANESHQGAALAGIEAINVGPCQRCDGKGTGYLMDGSCYTCEGRGEVAVCVDQLELLRRALKSAYRRVRELQAHTHDWTTGDDERGVTRCTICGANGDA